jgi:uncharacterized protein YuzE
MSIFAPETPTHSYDSRGDTLYIESSRDQAESTLEILNGWPMLLADLNADDKITDIEFVGAKQIGIKRLIDWGHAVWDAALRRWAAVAKQPLGAWPFPAFALDS